MTKPKPSPLNESGLIVGSCGRGFGYVRVTLARLQSCILAELDKRGKPLDLNNAALVQSAMRWEMAALAATKLCRTPDMKPMDKAKLLRQVAACSSERDQCFRLLGFDKSQTATLIDRLYGKRQSAPPNGGPTT